MKDSELWNKLLVVVERGDIVRFKYGKTEWEVLHTGVSDLSERVKDKGYIRLCRIQRDRKFHYISTVYKTIWHGTREYANLRIVKQHG